MTGPVTDLVRADRLAEGRVLRLVIDAPKANILSMAMAKARMQPRISTTNIAPSAT